MLFDNEDTYVNNLPRIITLNGPGVELRPLNRMCMRVVIDKIQTHDDERRCLGNIYYCTL